MKEKNQKLYEEIAGMLMQDIRDGKFQPGDRLPSERYLSKEYQVSRSVIREAICSMERVGCVESRVGEGTFVKAPELSAVVDPLQIIFSQDAQFAAEMTEARLLLETEIASLAAKRRTREQIKEMQETLDRMQRDVLKGGKGVEEDARFHVQLAEAAGNRVLQVLVSTCAKVLNDSMEVTQQIQGVPQKTIIDHEEILAAVEEQDAAKAEACMRQHLLRAYENLQKARENVSIER